VVETVRLYHGTTAGAADALAQHGSRAPEIDRMICDVARRFDIDEQFLRQHLKGAYVTVGHRRDTFSWTMHPAIARLYAGRQGGEAQREMVAAALRIVHPNLAAAQADLGAAELLAEPPALVTLQVPFDRVVDELPQPRFRRTPWTYDEWMEHAASFADFPAPNRRLPQPVPPRWIESVELVEPVVGEHSLWWYLPEDGALLMRSGSRPPSIGPRNRGIYTMTGVTAWLAEHGLQPIR